MGVHNVPCHSGHFELRAFAAEAVTHWSGAPVHAHAVERPAVWEEIEQALRRFETVDGFVGPCELLVASASWSSA
ncbi:MAG TPA: hypothetical protein VGR26_09795 [Acidimicrobiales bacterium]|nr:hypothetical protein [Acidimicrobiales bacterium]